MPAVWPPSLPQLPDVGHVESAPNTLLRTEMEVGPPKVRQRYTAGVRPVQMSISPLASADATTLDDFFISTLKGGSLPFDWQIPRSGATVSYRFIEPPKYEAIHPGSWRATFNLEILPQGDKR